MHVGRERRVQSGRPAPGVGEPDRTVKIWDATGKELFALRGHDSGHERGVQPGRPAPGIGGL